MITIFNRRRLWLDASAEAAARVWSALEAAGIPYEVKTLRSHSTFGRNFQDRKSTRLNSSHNLRSRMPSSA